MCAHTVYYKISPYQTREPSEGVYGNAWESPHLSESFANYLAYILTSFDVLSLPYSFSVLLGHFPNESLSLQLNRTQSLYGQICPKVFIQFMHQAISQITNDLQTQLGLPMITNRDPITSCSFPIISLL